jgi:hypothetical protein
VFFVLLAKGEKSSPFGELTRFASQKEKENLKPSKTIRKSKEEKRNGKKRL